MHATAPIGVDTEPSLVRNIAGPMKPICKTKQRKFSSTPSEAYLSCSLHHLTPAHNCAACVHAFITPMYKWTETITKNNFWDLM